MKDTLPIGNSVVNSTQDGQNRGTRDKATAKYSIYFESLGGEFFGILAGV